MSFARLIARLFVLGSIFTMAAADVILENREMRLVLSDTGRAISLIHKETGQECLVPGTDEPAFAITQYRPYINEIQLAFPARSTRFAANSVKRDGNLLRVRFELLHYEATISIKETDDYIGLAYRNVTALIEPERGVRFDEMMILQLPVRPRTNFGDWLNVAWDDEVAVNLLGTDPYAKIDSEGRPNYRLMRAAAAEAVKLDGVGAALITTRTSSLLDRIARVEEDFGLPRGVASRRNPNYKYSYYWTTDITPENVDRHIAYARQGGFRTMMIYYLAFTQSAGHYPFRPEYPNGMADIRRVVDRVKSAGLIPGLHFHYNKAHKHDSYVTPKPDPRLNLQKIFTLVSSIDERSTTIPVEENPRGSSMRDEQRLLKIGDEIVSYQAYSSSRPFQFTGCQRAQLGTKASDHVAGMKFGLLDVDEWPVFVRFDQRTSIQEEAAQRLGAIYKEAGFQFVYFDGAEDVHEPYWFYVSWPQWLVNRQMQPEPMFAEGAAKAHFSWHILTRGNAFDVFPPETIKEETATHPARQAPRIAADFTRLNFGWLNHRLPGDDSIGMQPDMFEYVTSRAAAWDCPISIQPRLNLLEQHPRTDDIFEVLRRWEEVRASNWLTQEQKIALRRTENEHHLLLDEAGGFELVQYRQVTPMDTGSPVRAFSFSRKGKAYVVFWHTSGGARLHLDLDRSYVRILEKLGQSSSPGPDGNGISVPLDRMRYVESDRLTEDQLAEAFRKSRLIQ